MKITLPFDIDLGATDYVSTFTNELGERMLFLARRGEPTASLYHTDSLIPSPQVVHVLTPAQLLNIRAEIEAAFDTAATEGGERRAGVAKKLKGVAGFLAQQEEAMAAEGQPVVGATVMDRVNLELSERQWLRTCWDASIHVREAAASQTEVEA